jgi:hypothetical protein
MYRTQYSDEENISNIKGLQLSTQEDKILYQDMLMHSSDLPLWIRNQTPETLKIIKEFVDNIKTTMEIIRNNNLYDNLVKSHKRTKKWWWPFGGKPKRMKTKRKKMKNTRKRIRKT